MVEPYPLSRVKTLPNDLFSRRVQLFSMSRSGHTACMRRLEPEGYSQSDVGDLENFEACSETRARCEGTIIYHVRSFPNWLASLMRFSKRGSIEEWIRIWKTQAYDARTQWDRVSLYEDWVTMEPNGVVSRSSFDKSARTMDRVGDPRRRFWDMQTGGGWSEYRAALQDPEAWELNDALFGRVPEWVRSEDQEHWESLRD